MKLAVKIAAAQAFTAGARSVAVLARTNDEVGAFRRYLAQQGLHPRPLGGDFEDARADIEQLPLLHDSQGIALLAVERLANLIPTLTDQVIQQTRRRLQTDGVNLQRASQDAARLLGPLQRIYVGGPQRYVEALVEAIDACAAAGHGLPRAESVRALRDTATAIAGEVSDLDDLLELYSGKVMPLAQRPVHAGRVFGRGLSIRSLHDSA